MKYQQGNIGRVFVVKFEHGDNIFDQLKELFKTEQIFLASIFLIGAIKKGKLVSGPRTAEFPPDAIWKKVDTPSEILGIGTIVYTENDPEPHIHITLGHGDKTLTGCLREFAEVFITVEAVIAEISGIKAFRKMDEHIKVRTLDMNDEAP